MLKRPSNQPQKRISTATKAHPAQAANATTPTKDNHMAGHFFLWRGTPFKGYHSQRRWGAKQATFQRGFGKHRRQEEAVSPENLMDEVSDFYGNIEAIKIFNTAASLLTLSSCSIRFLAKFIGQIVVIFPGVKYGPLWYRNMENDKIEGLKMSKGNFDANIQLSEMALAEISWWKENINSASNDTDAQSRHGEPDFIIFWDPSLLGWGFQNKLQTSCVHPGEPKPKRDMPAMWQSGAGMRTADTLIPYRHL